MIASAAVTIGFGYKCGWLAVRADDPTQALEQVRERGMEEIGPVEWADGVRRACSGELTFASGPIRGWIVIVARHPMHEDVSSFESRLVRMSRRFGEAQGFVSDRVTGHYRWARAVDGNLLRSFATIDGLVTRDQGARAAFEPMAAAPSVEPGGPSFLGAPPPPPLDEASVLRAAAAWSLDPTTIRDDEERAGVRSGRDWDIEWPAADIVRIATVASRKEAELHSAMLFRQGCLRCRAPHVESRSRRDDGPSHETEMHCGACGAKLLLRYDAVDGWQDQPDYYEPRLTNRTTPSALLPPQFLLQIAQEWSKDVQ